MVSHCPAKAANLRVIRVQVAAAPPANAINIERR